MRIPLILFFAVTVEVVAQTPKVPDKLQFADLTLAIRDDARRLIQADVDALTAHPKSFQTKVARAQIYFPIIEKIFREENIPDDFKFLVLQESALIPDAVSVSNAVGFWQFKDFTGIENGLQINTTVDERMNIVSATRAAARYLNKNNSLFNNWLYTLQSYQMGAGGVMKAEKERTTSRHMEITSTTYWYVRKYLAHKIAFGSAIRGPGEINLVVLNSRSGQTLQHLATELAIEEAELLTWNKWLRKNIIPEDKPYPIVVPVRQGATLALNQADAVATTNPAVEPSMRQNQKLLPTRKSTVVWRKTINGIHALPAEPGETPAKLATRAGVELDDFLRWNDLEIDSRIEPGRYYLAGPKRRRAETEFHTVQPRETLWLISQDYGVTLRRLRRYNRMTEGEEVRPGQVLWLAARKPANGQQLGPADPQQVVQLDQEIITFSGESQTSLTSQSGNKSAVEASNSSSVSITDTQKVTNQTADHQEIGQQGGSELKAVDPKKDEIQAVVPQKPTKMPETTVIVANNEVADTLRTHEVMAGDTWYGLARKYQVGVMDLISFNEANLQTPLKPGQKIKLPDIQAVKQEVKADSTIQAKPRQEHIVKSSDTVYSIARQYGVTIKELLDMNGKKDFHLTVGERLKVSP